MINSQSPPGWEDTDYVMLCQSLNSIPPMSGICRRLPSDNLPLNCQVRNEVADINTDTIVILEMIYGINTALMDDVMLI